MPVQWNTVTLPLTMGIVEGAVDGVIAPEGTLRSCENLYYDKPGRLVKRTGFAQLSSIVDYTVGGWSNASGTLRACAAAPGSETASDNVRYAVTDHELLQLTQASWVNIDDYHPCTVERTEAYRDPQYDADRVDVARVGYYLLTVTLANSRIYWTAADADSGARLTGGQVGSDTNVVDIRVVQLVDAGNSGEYAVCVWTTADGSMYYATFRGDHPTTSGPGWGSATSLSITAVRFDANVQDTEVAQPDGLVLVYNDATNIYHELRQLSSGALSSATNTSNFAHGVALGAIQGLAVAANNSYSWIAWHNGTLLYVNRHDLGAGTVSGASVGQGVNSAAQCLGGVAIPGAERCAFFWGARPLSLAKTGFRTYWGIWSNASPPALVGSLEERAYVGPLTRPWCESDGSYLHIAMTSDEAFFPTGGSDIADTDKSAIVLSFKLDGTGAWSDEEAFRLTAFMLPGRTDHSRDTDSIEMPAAVVEQFDLGDARRYWFGLREKTTAELETPSGKVIEARYASSAWKLDFTDGTAGRATQYGSSLYFSGGLVHQFDGLNLFENGFISAPWVYSDQDQNSGGDLADGDYYCRFVYEWWDAQGNRHQSWARQIQNAGGKAVVSGGSGSGRFDLEASCIPLTNKQPASGTPGVAIVCYRGVVNGGENEVYYRTNGDPLGSSSTQWNDPSIAGGTTNVKEWTEGTTGESRGDTDIVNHEVLYTGGALGNDMIPGGRWLESHKGRLWVGGGYEVGKVYYSQPDVPNLPARFSLALYVTLPEGAGKVTGLASHGDGLLVFTERAVYVVLGDGPSPSGAGNQFRVQLVTDNVGCTDGRSIAQIPAGTMFLSLGGIRLITHGLQVQDIGSPVDHFIYGDTEYTGTTYPTPVGTAVVQDRALAILGYTKATTAGILLVYHYDLNLWTTWHPAQNISLDGGETARNGDGAALAMVTQNDDKTLIVVNEPLTSWDVFEESTASYTDGSYTYETVLESTWLTLGSADGYKRFRRVFLRGERAASGTGVGVTLTTRHPARAATQAVTFGNTDLGTTPVNLRVRSDDQKADLLRVKVVDTPTASGGSGRMIWQTIAIEAATKTGGPRLPSAQTE